MTRYPHKVPLEALKGMPDGVTLTDDETLPVGELWVDGPKQLRAHPDTLQPLRLAQASVVRAFRVGL